MAKAFLKIIWKSATIEEYKPGQLINNGKAQSDTDLLYVLEGSIVYRLEKTDLTTLSRALFVEFSKSEYIDMKTLSSKRIKTLANMDFNRGLGADKRMILEEESSLCISEITESENSQPVEVEQYKRQHNPKNPFLDCTIDEIRAKGLSSKKVSILRIPNREYKVFVLDYFENEHSIFTTRGLQQYVLDNFEEVKGSAKLKKQVKMLAQAKFLPPNTVIAAEGQLCDHINLVIGGRVDVFRKIKENIESLTPGEPQDDDVAKKIDHETVELEIEQPAPYGDMVATLYPTQKHPRKIGEENVLLSIANPCSFVTKSYCPVIKLDLGRFFRCLKDANLQIITEMKQRCALKMNNTMSYINSKIRGEILKEEMGYVDQHKRIIPLVQAQARNLVSQEVVPMHKKIHNKPFFKRQIQKSSYFQQAQRPARRTLK